MRWFNFVPLVLLFAAIGCSKKEMTTSLELVEKETEAEKKDKKSKKVLTKEFSSPLKDVVVWKPNSYKFGEECTYDLPGRGKINYGKHLGEDYNIKAGTSVFACADGRISLNREFPGTPEKPSWGGLVVIGHWLTDKVAMYTIYGHLEERDENLKPGKIVRRGQQIGKVARSKSPQNGNWDERSHLHLQFLLDPQGKYRRDMVPAGYHHYLKDGKPVLFDAPHRLLDYIAPSEVLNAKDPVALLITEEANPKRK